MRKNKTLIQFIPIFVFLILLINFSTSLAQTPSTSQPSQAELEKKAMIGRDLVFHRKYEEALNYFKGLTDQPSTALLGTFGQMAIWQARMFENYDFSFDKEFEAISKENEKYVDQVQEASAPQAFDLFIAGASAGVRGFYLMRKDAPFKALRQANLAKKLMNQTLEKDPSFGDAYLGLGMYDYWRSVFTNRIKFLPFFSDKRPQGLQQIEKSLTTGHIAGALSQVSLAFCYLESKNHQKAIPVLETILKNYPENVIAKNLLADFYSLRGSFKEAHQMADTILQQNPEIKVARFFKGTFYFKEKKLAEARRMFEEFLKTQPAPAWASYAHTNLGYLDLKEGQKDKAYEHFKEAYHLYSNDPTPLREMKKLRGSRF